MYNPHRPQKHSLGIFYKLSQLVQLSIRNGLSIHSSELLSYQATFNLNTHPLMGNVERKHVPMHKLLTGYRKQDYFDGSCMVIVSCVLFVVLVMHILLISFPVGTVSHRHSTAARHVFLAAHSTDCRIQIGNGR
jgi:hypothetical protein